MPVATLDETKSIAKNLAALGYGYRRCVGTEGAGIKGARTIFVLGTGEPIGAMDSKTAADWLRSLAPTQAPA